jgi:hypothetical protein
MKRNILIFCTLISGCYEDVKSEQYYSSNLHEAIKVIESCSSQKKWNQNCENASEAILNTRPFTFIRNIQ